MIKLIRYVLVTMLILLCTLAMVTFAYGEEGVKGVVIGDDVNVREQPSTESATVGRMHTGDCVQVIDSNGEWHQVALDDKAVGWIYNQFIVVENQNRDLIKLGFVDADSLNVRQEPNVDSNIVRKLFNGTQVKIVEETSGWYCIVLDDESKGWVSKDYIKNSLNDHPTSRSMNRSMIGAKAVEIGMNQLGKRYVYGTNGPNTFDCSGFTSYVYKQIGIKLPRSSRDQATVGEKVSRDDLQIGDLVFFNGDGSGPISHVGMYVGDGEFIHASSGSRMQVIISSFDDGHYNKRYVTARRFF